jgi:hypothetical protein
VITSLAARRFWRIAKAADRFRSHDHEQEGRTVTASFAQLHAIDLVDESGINIVALPGARTGA